MKPILFAALVLAGCSKKDAPKEAEKPPAGSGASVDVKLSVTASPPADAAPPPPVDAAAPAADPVPSTPPGPALPAPVIAPAMFKQPVAISLAGRPFSLKGGLAYAGFNGGMLVELYNEAIDCDKKPSDAALQLKFQVAAGPGQTWLQGHVIALSMSARSDKLKISEDFDSLLQVTSVDNKQNGRMKGTFAFDAKGVDDNAKPKVNKGGGTFDIPVCNPAKPYAVPETLTGKLAATMKGKDFAPNKGLAFLSHDDTNPDLVYISQILFFADPSVTCATHPKPDAIGIALDELVLNSKTTALGTAQQIEGAVQEGGGSGKLFAAAWASFERADLRPGGQVTGTAYVASDPDAKPDVTYKLAGPFTATVCK